MRPLDLELIWNPRRYNPINDSGIASSDIKGANTDASEPARRKENKSHCLVIPITFATLRTPSVIR